MFSNLLLILKYGQSIYYTHMILYALLKQYIVAALIRIVHSYYIYIGFYIAPIKS